MKQAYLTFIRKKYDDCSFLAIENPNNLTDLDTKCLRSGQPIIIIKENDTMLALYIVSKNADLFQIYGEQDYLFFMKMLNDLSLINIRKYNFIRQILLNTFDELSIQEAKTYNSIFDVLEETIFYTTLHTELSNVNIKNILLKELKKINVPSNLKQRLLIKAKSMRTIPENYLKKKIDVDLTGYGIYINTLK